jgi:hypothetical protein
MGHEYLITALVFNALTLRPVMGTKFESRNTDYATRSHRLTSVLPLIGVNMGRKNEGSRRDIPNGLSFSGSNFSFRPIQDLLEL